MGRAEPGGAAGLPAACRLAVGAPASAVHGGRWPDGPLTASAVANHAHSQTRHPKTSSARPPARLSETTTAQGGTCERERADKPAPASTMADHAHSDTRHRKSRDDRPDGPTPGFRDGQPRPRPDPTPRNRPGRTSTVEARIRARAWFSGRWADGGVGRSVASGHGRAATNSPPRARRSLRPGDEPARVRIQP